MTAVACDQRHGGCQVTAGFFSGQEHGCAFARQLDALAVQPFEHRIGHLDRLGERILGCQRIGQRYDDSAGTLQQPGDHSATVEAAAGESAAMKVQHQW